MVCACEGVSAPRSGTAARWYDAAPEVPMAERKLVAEGRAGTGKGVARKLRAAGRVPAVVYGHGRKPMPVSVDSKDLYRVLHTRAGTNVLMDLVVDGKEHLAMPREIQRDHITGRLTHVDFLIVSRSEKITVTAPIRVVGEAPGVKAGGVLEHHLWDLHVECLPGDVPEALEADISALGVGDSLRVGNIVPPKGVTILTPADESVLSVVIPQVRVVEEVPVEEVEAAVAPAEAAAVPTGESPEEGGEG
jgi:large subunit ribosomal protein L25